MKKSSPAESLLPFEVNINAPDCVKYPDDLLYFTEAEFNACNPACSLMDMDSHFMYNLDMCRSFARVPFKILSAFRSVDWEIKHGRKGTSSHCKGLAVDILCTDDRLRWKIVSALQHGLDYPRLGIARTYIHVDMDKSKPSAIWLYD